MPTITKEQAARILDKTPRAVERYTSQGRLSVTYEKGKTRDVAVYDEDEVKRLADELKQSRYPARPAVALPSEPTPALTPTRRDNTDIAVSEFFSQLRAAMHEGTDRQRPTITDLAHKLLLTEREAAQLSGLPYSEIVKTREALKSFKTGAGWRVKRELLEAYIKKLR